MAAIVLPESWYARRDLLTFASSIAALLVWAGGAWHAWGHPGASTAVAVAYYCFLLAALATFWWPQAVRRRAERAQQVPPADERELRIQNESLRIGMGVLVVFTLVLAWPAVLVEWLDLPLAVPGGGWCMLWMELGLTVALASTTGMRLLRYRA